MEIDAGVNEIVHFIMGKKATIPVETVAHSSVPPSLLTEDFSKRLNVVLNLRQRLVFDRWKKFFNNCYSDMLSSRGKYLYYVMYACLYEHQCNPNMFDSFISVCILVRGLSGLTFGKTGVDLSDLNPDIIMVFYRNALKTSFHECNGLHRFVEYIRGHKYLEWVSNRKNLPSTVDPSASMSLEKDFHENMNEELISYRASEILSKEKKSAVEKGFTILAREVLANISARLPDLPSEHDLIERMVEYRKKEKANEAERKRKVETALTFEISHGGSNSDSKIDFAEHREDIARYENIIQAVIRHNHSKNVAHEDANNQIQEVDGILSHLKNTISSLTKVLEECNEE